MDLSRPYPSGWTVRRGLDEYLRENGFTKEGYTAAWTDASFLGVSIKIPNTKLHQLAIMRHDLHHVATGYGTDVRGEAEISVWETAKSLDGIGLYVTAIVLGLAATGALIAPVRMWRAFRAAKGKGNLFQVRDYEGLLDLTIGELRERLGVGPEGVAGPRELHSNAPKHARDRDGTTAAAALV